MVPIHEGPPCLLKGLAARIGLPPEHPALRVIQGSEVGRTPAGITEDCAIPLYFFHIQGAPFPEDEEGTILTGPEQARAAAVTLAGEMLKDVNGKFWDGPEWRLNVTDEEGATVCTLSITGRTGDA